MLKVNKQITHKPRSLRLSQWIWGLLVASGLTFCGVFSLELVRSVNEGTITPFLKAFQPVLVIKNRTDPLYILSYYSEK